MMMDDATRKESKRQHKFNQCIALNDNRIGIILTKGKICVIDSADYHLIKNFTWGAKNTKKFNNYYAKTSFRLENGKFTTLTLHRLIMNIRDSKNEIDHINHDTLNCSRINLRVANKSENMCNRKIFKNNLSGFKNICWNELRQKWVVRIIKNHVKHWKFFDNISDACEWKNKMLPVIHGKFHHD